MSKCDSSDTSDEEYVPNDVSSSDSEGAEELIDTEEAEPASTESTSKAATVVTEERAQELWASFKTEVETEQKTRSAPPQQAESAVKSAPKRKSELSLNNILGNKKPAKVSILDQSKRDWDKFINEEGIKDDLRIFNRGKQGFLGRKAFEARTEDNQFEIEKSLRLSAASKLKK